MAMPWKKILCPVDFSDPARAAMKAAAEVTAHFDGELTLFHAYQLPGYTLPEGSVVASPKMLQDLAEQAEAHLAEWRALAQAMGASRVVTAKGIGDPALEVVQLARDGGFDLIVVGTPIYNDRPMRSVFHFLMAGSLRKKPVALFIVCFAGIFGMRNFMVRKYLDDLREACDCHVVKETSFDSAGGPWRKLNRAVCIDFGEELASLSHNPPAALETA
jgi:menaquinone-dependent protoporphyrinogen oxidase